MYGLLNSLEPRVVGHGIGLPGKPLDLSNSLIEELLLKVFPIHMQIC